MFVTLKYFCSTELPKEIDYFIQCTNCSLQADSKNGKGRQTFVVVPLKRTCVNFTEKWEEDSCRCVVGHLFVSSTRQCMKTMEEGIVVRGRNAQ
jgi:hypothetical protein